MQKGKVLVWSRLKNMECPKCKFELMTSKETGDYLCTSFACDFKISKEAFDRTIENLYKPQRSLPPRDNFAELQNHGTTEQTNLQ